MKKISVWHTISLTVHTQKNNESNSQQHIIKEGDALKSSPYNSKKTTNNPSGNKVINSKNNKTNLHDLFTLWCMLGTCPASSSVLHIYPLA